MQVGISLGITGNRRAGAPDLASIFKTGDIGQLLLPQRAGSAYSTSLGTTSITSGLVGLLLDQSAGRQVGAGMYLGLDLVPDYWIDAAGGNDSNAGTSEGAAWKSLKKAADTVYGVSKAGQVVVRVKTGTYATVDDWFEITTASAVSNGGLTLVFEPGCVMDGTTAVASVNRNGFEFSTGADWPVYVYGNGLTVQNYANSFGSPNGIGNRGGNVLRVYDIDVDNCDDGLSAHGNATIYAYRCNFANCVKSAYAHIETSRTYHYQCTFTERASSTLGVGSNQSSNTAYFEDCKLIPAATPAAIGVGNSNFVRCWIGTATVSISLAGVSSAGASTYTDCFISVSRDVNQPMIFTRCYGRASFRQRNGGSLTMRNCVISSPASGLTNIFYSNFNPGSGSPHIIENNIFETASAGAFMSYDATNSGHVVAAGSRWHNNVLSGSAAFDADLIAADTGGTVLVGNVTGDALIGAANTTNPADYGYEAGSPAIGAGIGGVNCGFPVTDALSIALVPAEARGPAGVPGYHATQATAGDRPTLSASELDFTGAKTMATTFPDLGTDVTIAYADPGVGAVILTAQTVGAGAYSGYVDHNGWLMIDRALTAEETAFVEREFDKLAGV
jgi:hypothetical protein